MIHDLTYDGACYILEHLRDYDERELRATIFDGDVDVTARHLYNVPGPKWQVDLRDGTPAILGGVTPVWEGVAAVWMLGTTQMKKAILEVTKLITKDIFPTLDQAGVHRVECRALAGDDLILRWLHLIGMHEEAVTPQFGRGGEDFILLARHPHARPCPTKIHFQARQARGCATDASQLRFAFLP